MFRFIDAEKTSFPIAFVCRQLGVSKAGYYAWKQRPPSARAVADARLTTTIHAIHAGSRGTYGAPRIHAELADEHGIRCGRKRVARLMRSAGLRGVCRRRQVRTTRRDELAQISDDLVHRQFRATEPNRLWVADITYLPTRQQCVYLSLVTDACSRKIVGWHVHDTLQTEGVCKALAMALRQRQSTLPLLHHSDRGIQYCAEPYQQLHRQHGIRCSMTDGYDCYQNALAERVNGILKEELLLQRPNDLQQAREMVKESVAIYNHERPHLSLKCRTPDEVHRAFFQQDKSATLPFQKVST